MNYINGLTEKEMAKRKEKLERRVIFKPAYDKRNANPKKNYGIHCVEVWFILIGKKGAVHFGFTTGMYLPQQYKEKTAYMMGDSPNYMAIDRGYHSYKPMYDGQKVNHPTRMIHPKGGIKKKKIGKFEIPNVKFRKIGKKPPNCLYLGKPCYCDGSALDAQRFLDVLVSKGDEPVWEMLRDYYSANFNENKRFLELGFMVGSLFGNAKSGKAHINAKRKNKKG